MLNEVLKLYSYGYDIEVIAEDFDKTEEEILETLRQYKKSQKHNFKGFSQEFADLLIERNKAGVSPYRMYRELELGTTTVDNLFKKNNHTAIEKDEADYVVIGHDRFDKCPDCGNEKDVKDLSRYCLEGLPKNAYCPCGTEWYLEAGEVRKVIFHHLS